MTEFSLKQYDISCTTVTRNASPAALYELALKTEKGSHLCDLGALVCRSGQKTGRSPKDKRVVKDPASEKKVWWGSVNMPIEESVFFTNKERAIDYLNTCPRLYVVDGFANAHPKYRFKVRVITSRAYHALFMHNMLIRPTQEELQDFGEPDAVIFNAGDFPANRYTAQMTSKTSVNLSIERKELVILGTAYAGEMKKGVFSLLHYLMPEKDILSMHCSANESEDGQVSLFFGLSGTGKTTLSADPLRKLIGDDEHCWSEDGVFNIEGGCYAKCINLSEEKEPEIFHAIRFGTVLENVVLNQETLKVDFNDDSISVNTRASYPIDFIENRKVPSYGTHPSHIIFLSCDAFGVLPPVSKLDANQAMYHFISGYTSKIPGTEMGVNEPIATFSACFGAAFLLLHPARYAELLAKKMNEHKVHVWLINTGWSGGGFGTGKRMSLKHTRAIIDAIHAGSLESVTYQKNQLFGFEVPTTCPGVPSEILDPKMTWEDGKAYDEKAKHLAKLFAENFNGFKEGCSEAICKAGPVL